MLNKLQILEMAHGLAGHAATRQATVARNIANADTPGYKARDVTDFAQQLRHGQDMRSTRAQHLNHPSPGNAQPLEFVVDGASSPNGNSVSLETEMVKATEVRHQHDLALSVYSSSLNILRTSLGRGR